jgi:hypothetical protein
MAATVAGSAMAAVTCADDGHQDLEDLSSDDCRLDPEGCDGGAGGLCHHDSDCADPLFCCTDNGNCGGGMCTADCHDDRDCPGDMLCEHGMCFYACDDDRDCATTMSCEHDRTVCEYN